MNDDLTEITANIYLLSRVEGGRHTGIKSQYRPTFFIGTNQSDGAVYLIGQEWLQPGQECKAKIKFLRAEAFGDNLKTNTEFEIKEGLKLVGRGTILNV